MRFDVPDQATLSRSPLHEATAEERRLAVAYDDGVERLSAMVATAIATEDGWAPQLSTGLRAGLDFLAADPPLAHLLLVESLAGPRLVRRRRERALARLTDALRPPHDPSDRRRDVPEETARLLAGGLVSHLSGRVLAGEAERLPELHQLLLAYLLAPSRQAAPLRSAAHQRDAARK
jgi:hypothetical protein